MERIEDLINRLKDQFDQKADASQLQLTVQLIQYELSQLPASSSKTLGTSKVAVVMPTMNVPPQYEKYAPKVQAEPSVVIQMQKNANVPVPVQTFVEPATTPEPAPEEIKETILVDNGSLSVVQENGQLDMVFDPMTEIPTMSNQPAKEKEVNDANTREESINDKLRQGKTELVEILKESPVKDLRKAIGINDRFLFINELFRGDEAMYERSIKTINGFNIYPEAEYWINRELKVKIGWNNESQTVQHFDQLVKRRFS